MRGRVRTAILAGAGVAVAVLVLAGATPRAWARDIGLARIAYQPRLYGPDQPLPDVLAAQGIALSGGFLPGARIEVEKEARRLLLYSGEKLLKTYRIQLGPNPAGTKRARGDGRTPEGSYIICSRNPRSKYYLSLLLNYPDETDITRSLETRRLSRTQAAQLRRHQQRHPCPSSYSPLGGDIAIHGQHPDATAFATAHPPVGPSVRADLEAGDIDPSTLAHAYDWTQGCIGLTNPDIRELFRCVADGTPVVIRP